MLNISQIIYINLYLLYTYTISNINVVHGTNKGWKNYILFLCCKSFHTLCTYEMNTTLDLEKTNHHQHCTICTPTFLCIEGIIQCAHYMNEFSIFPNANKSLIQLCFGHKTCHSIVRVCVYCMIYFWCGWFFSVSLRITLSKSFL